MILTCEMVKTVLPAIVFAGHMPHPRCSRSPQRAQEWLLVPKFRPVTEQQLFNPLSIIRDTPPGTSKWMPCGGQEQPWKPGNLRRGHCPSGDTHVASDRDR